MQKVRVRADVRKNRLYVVLAGFLDDDEARQAADQVIQEIKNLRPGFDIINDISGFKPATQKGAREMIRAHALPVRLALTGSFGLSLLRR